YLATHVGPVAEIPTAEMKAMLQVERRYFGRGYGVPTRSGRAAITRMHDAGGPPLDLVYSAKSGAALFDLIDRAAGPLLFWSTKSSAPLPQVDEERLQATAARLRRWLARRPL